jgi:hypothetical protein
VFLSAMLQEFAGCIPLSNSGRSAPRQGETYSDSRARYQGGKQDQYYRRRQIKLHAYNPKKK